MKYEVDVTVKAWALWAPRVGWVLNSVQYGRDRAALALADRKANGEAFKGERVRRLRARVAVELADGGVTGYLIPVIVAGGSER